MYRRSFSQKKKSFDKSAAEKNTATLDSAGLKWMGYLFTSRVNVQLYNLCMGSMAEANWSHDQAADLEIQLENANQVFRSVKALGQSDGNDADYGNDADFFAQRDQVKCTMIVFHRMTGHSGKLKE